MARILYVHDSMVFSEDQVLVRKTRIVVQHVPCSYVMIVVVLSKFSHAFSLVMLLTFFRPCSLWVSGNHLLALLVSFQIALFS